MPDTPARILVVDDEPDLEPMIRQRFRGRIRESELVFSFARDGREAIDVLTNGGHFDLVLTDINMPRMDGLTLLAELGGRTDVPRFLRTVVVTAYGDMENIRTAMNRGAFDFLTKPLNLDDLEITINNACRTVAQQRRDVETREALSRYIPEGVVATLLEDPDALLLGRRRISILLSDIRGFSAITERLDPEIVVEILNIYLEAMADVILGHHGTIDEIIGDAILVFFGAPISRGDEALRAVACALDMHGAMAEVNTELSSRGLPMLSMGIGVHSGDVVVGNIGSARRQKYGAVGSAVNLTARLESYTVGGQILTTESTLEEAGSTVMIGREMKLSAKGFSEPLSIYEVTGVGAPYNRSLPLTKDRLVSLERPLPTTFSILDGKHMTGDEHQGEITALSESGAILSTDRALEPLENLRLVISDHGANEVGDLYAKVIDAAPEESSAELRFTAVPEEVAELIHPLVAE